MTRWSILVIDDDEDTRELLVEILAHRGFAATGCANGDEGLARLRQPPAPELVLLDLAMPIRTGYEFRTAQREDAAIAGVPVIVMTSEQDPDLDALAVDTLIPKPFKVEQLVSAITARMGARARGS